MITIEFTNTEVHGLAELVDKAVKMIEESGDQLTTGQDGAWVKVASAALSATRSRPAGPARPPR